MMKSAQLGIVKVVSLLGLVIAVSGCASTAPTDNPTDSQANKSVIDQPDSTVEHNSANHDIEVDNKKLTHKELARLTMEPRVWMPFKGPTWYGHLKQITAENGDKLLKRKTRLDRLKSYTTIDVTPGKYYVEVLCFSRNEGSPTLHLNISVDTKKSEETVFRCDEFKTDQRDFLGFRKKAVRLKVLEVKPIEHDKSSRKEIRRNRISL